MKQSTADPLDRALGQLLTLVDERCRAKDKKFAQAYVAWVEAGKPAAEVIPIEQVTKQLGTPYLRGNAKRKLLLVVMDGMSQATAVQLLKRLGEQHRWHPLAWHPSGWHGRLSIPPVLAVAPTLTEVSRAALFAGVADPRFGDQGTDRDGARWAGNSSLKEFAPGKPLAAFFRSDLSENALSPEVNNAIASDDRVVAVVVNAIDEDLKGSLQVRKDYYKNAIAPLEALLAAAEGAERAILLVADHGHIPGLGAKTAQGRLSGNRVGGARWRALHENETPAEGEVLLPPQSWRPRGSAGVAVLWDTAITNSAPHYGEHGGLSLAEAVAPAYLIGPEWLERLNGEDLELTCQPLEEPAWWNFRLPKLKLATPRQEITVPTPAVAQMALPVIAPTVSKPIQPTVPSEPDLVRALRESKTFQDQISSYAKTEVEHVLRWLGRLVDAGDVLSAEDFAKVCGVRPHQVSGVVARMGILNADGFAMIEYDALGRRVVLQRSRLAQQYGLPS